MPRIELVVSRLGGVPGVGSAYHSSVLIDGAEFFFSDTGLMRVPPREPGCDEVASHVGVGTCTEVFEMGASSRMERQLVKALGPFFLPGTYDFVRKNCNSFSDCALYFLIGKRLDPKYRELDLMGIKMHSKLPSFLAAASMGTYSANEAADGFDVEATIEKLATARSRSASPKRSRASRCPGKQLRMFNQEEERRQSMPSLPCESIVEQPQSPKAPSPPPAERTRRWSLRFSDPTATAPALRFNIPLEQASALPGAMGDDSPVAANDASTTQAGARTAPVKDFRLRLAEEGEDMSPDAAHNEVRWHSMQSLHEAASEALLPQAKLVKRYVRRHSESAAQAIQKAMKGVQVCCVPTVVDAELEDCDEEEDSQVLADQFAGYGSVSMDTELGSRYLSERGCEQKVEAQISERTRATYGEDASISFDGL